MDASEVLTNIGANLAEILGVAAGLILVLGSVVPAILRRQGYVKKMLVFGVGLLFAGLLAPPLINAACDLNKYLGLIVAWLLCIPITAGFFATYFFPAKIAGRGKSKYPLGILLLNLAFFIPFNWYFAFVLALKNEKIKDGKQADDNTSADESCKTG